MAPSWEGTRGVLLDVEGTTTPVAFVHDALFPYALARLPRFVSQGQADGELAALHREYTDDSSARKPPWADAGDRDGALAYLTFLMSVDRKSTALKALQGRIWEQGYRLGEIRGAVYPDVPQALRRWHGQGRRIAIFSSGSVLAQQLLFGSTVSGDLRPWLAGYFDTTTGAKADPSSYGRIAEVLEIQPSAILFLSDAAVELDAARTAGLQVALCVRSAPDPESPFPIVRTFDSVLPG